ncbi:high-potential iron-sulfur protein [Paraburkholderia terrae]|uniref:high-potential iron-sulfur protein n=1 Tax=Paraburkholderia terrae TaxID=311230 RepID=UPI00296B1FC1|nr:high-potential iron-sulfur protein [Paraburkholderia terrae]MDW3658521.1 high-potential iron-sulfur protein [Paraburkholderia terrae]
MHASRRHFIALAAAMASSPLLIGTSMAAPSAVAENDPTAQSLGYKSDAARVDKVKFSKYQAGQACANCQLYQGKAGDASGPCPLFAGKEVSAKGWCSAYVKRA